MSDGRCWEAGAHLDRRRFHRSLWTWTGSRSPSGRRWSGPIGTARFQPGRYGRLNERPQGRVPRVPKPAQLSELAAIRTASAGVFIGRGSPPSYSWRCCSPVVASLQVNFTLLAGRPAGRESVSAGFRRGTSAHSPRAAKRKPHWTGFYYQITALSQF